LGRRDSFDSPKPARTARGHAGDLHLGSRGEMLYQHRTWANRVSLITRCAVPLIVAWPGVLPQGRTSEALVQMIDLYPTLLGYARAGDSKISPGEIAVAPSWQGKTEKQWDVWFTAELEGGKVMQFDGRYRVESTTARAQWSYTTCRTTRGRSEILLSLPEFQKKTEAKLKELRQWRATDVAPETSADRSRKSARLKNRMSPPIEE